MSFAGGAARGHTCDSFRVKRELRGLAGERDVAILAVSQSGETADALNSVDFARRCACRVLGITNTSGSTLTRASREYVLQNAGPEVGVAATKTLTSQILVLA